MPIIEQHIEKDGGLKGQRGYISRLATLAIGQSTQVGFVRGTISLFSTPRHVGHIALYVRPHWAICQAALLTLKEGSACLIIIEGATLLWCHASVLSVLPIHNQSVTD